MGVGKSVAVGRLATQHAVLAARFLPATSTDRSWLKVFDQAKDCRFRILDHGLYRFASLEFQHLALERKRSLR